MSDKSSRSFDGSLGGAAYDLVASLTGFGPTFYDRVAWTMPLRPGSRVLDIGCGTANLGLAAARRLGPAGEVVGLDIAAKQLAAARSKTAGLDTAFTFHLGSMDALPFDDDSFDAVVTCMALHAAPPEVRRAAVREVARVLRPDGFFGLADIGRPRPGLVTFIWLPTILPTPRAMDYWRNAYPGICRDAGLELITDTYVNSLIRSQIYRPGGQEG